MRDVFETVFYDCYLGRLSKIQANPRFFIMAPGEMTYILRTACIHDHLEIVNWILDRLSEIDYWKIHLSKIIEDGGDIFCEKGALYILNQGIERLGIDRIRPLIVRAFPKAIKSSRLKLIQEYWNIDPEYLRRNFNPEYLTFSGRLTNFLIQLLTPSYGMEWMSSILHTKFEIKVNFAGQSAEFFPIERAPDLESILAMAPFATAEMIRIHPVGPNGENILHFLVKNEKGIEEAIRIINRIYGPAGVWTALEARDRDGNTPVEMILNRSTPMYPSINFLFWLHPPELKPQFGNTWTERNRILFYEAVGLPLIYSNYPLEVRKDAGHYRYEIFFRRSLMERLLFFV